MCPWSWTHKHYIDNYKKYSLCHIMKNNNTGIYHGSNPQPITNQRGSNRRSLNPFTQADHRMVHLYAEDL